MREILFRGKRYDGIWEEGYLVVDDVGTYWIFPQNQSIPRSVDFVIVNPETVGQFTGLFDKNSNKIFEGDVVLYKIGTLDLGTRYPVYFSEERGGYFPFAHGDGCGCCEDETIWDPEWCEIIGSIHDNPELEEVDE